MTLHCSKCNLPFTSLIITHELAVKELSDKMFKHHMSEHSDEFRKFVLNLQARQVELAFLVAMKNLTVVSKEESWLTKEMEKAQDNIMSMLGFDAEREEMVVPVVEKEVTQ